jgi:hypothetical protein
MSEKKDYRKIKKAPLLKRANVILNQTEKLYQLVSSIKETCYCIRILFFVSISNKGSLQMFNILAITI